ncbi:MAG: hypothetical protein HRT47_05315 [Candidatus Caenarcaniphilales bacterium]|nr:hypothetical protein [Candidatus Caenarcaniphilales bacterium]
MREDDQELFAGNFIAKTNVLLLLKTGKTEEALNVLEDSLESELETIKGFNESNIKTVAFYNAGLVNENCEKEIFNDGELKEEIELAKVAVKQVQSQTCHPTKKCTGGAWCFRMPWSLKAVDVNKNGIWRYIVGSNCGFTLRGNGCGEPVTGSVCLN